MGLRGCCRRLLAIASLAAGMLHGAPAQAADPDEHHYQSWLGLFAHGPVAGDFWIWSDVHLRANESFEPNTVIVRPGFSWRATPTLFLTAGYGWTPALTRTDGAKSWGDLELVDEHRIWQQLLWMPSEPRTGVAAQVRGRLEQRFRPGDPEVGSRLRLLWRGQAPISPDRAWIFVVWNELFVALQDTDWGQRRGFDQNRAFVGVGYQIPATPVRLELGYTNRWTVRKGPDSVDHILALNVYFGW